MSRTKARFYDSVRSFEYIFVHTCKTKQTKNYIQKKMNINFSDIVGLYCRTSIKVSSARP